MSILPHIAIWVFTISHSTLEALGEEGTHLCTSEPDTMSGT